jgi:predicted  nucleic acid-binding Zn-ribbon protein
MVLLVLFLQSASWPNGWTVIGWAVAAVVAMVYLFSGVLEKLSSGRKELLEVSDKKLAASQKEKDQLEYKIKSLEEQLDKVEDEKNSIEKEKLMLLREHHQLLEISVTDLQTLKSNAKQIEQLEIEIQRLREEKGLPSKGRSNR